MSQNVDEVPSEDIIAELKRLGWSVGDVAFRGICVSFTLVTCHCGKQLISVKAKNSREAWVAALQQALEMEEAN